MNAVRRSHAYVGGEQDVLGVGLLVAAPARVTVHVDGRGIEIQVAVVPLADLLVLLYLLLVAVDPVAVTDVYQFRLVFAVIVYRRIVGIKDLVLLELRIRDRYGGDQGVRIRMEREVEQLVRPCR